MNILIIIGCVLLAIWLAGVILHLLVGIFALLIHFILIVAIAMIIYGFIQRRRRI